MKIKGIGYLAALDHPLPGYIVGIRPSDGKGRPEDMSSGEVASFLARHPEVETTPVVARCLCFLETFAP